MNPILEKWLAEKQAEVEKKRKAFLIKQGLVDESKTTVVFKDLFGNILTEEEVKAKQESGLGVERCVTHDALDLTDEEYNQVLAYAQPENNEETTYIELLQKISRHTGIVSTILIIYVILSVIIGIIIGVKLG